MDKTCDLLASFDLFNEAALATKMSAIALNQSRNEKTDVDEEEVFDHKLKKLKIFEGNPTLDTSFIKVREHLNDFHYHIVNSGAFDGVKPEVLERMAFNVMKMSRQSYIYNCISNVYQTEFHDESRYRNIYDVRNVFSVSFCKTDYGYDKTIFKSDSLEQRTLLWLPLNGDQLVQYLTEGIYKNGGIHVFHDDFFGDGLYCSEMLYDSVNLWSRRKLSNAIYCVLVAVVMKNCAQTADMYVPRWPSDNSFPDDCDSVRIQGFYRSREARKVKIDNQQWVIRIGEPTQYENGLYMNTCYKIKSPAQMRAAYIVELQPNNLKHIVREVKPKVDLSPEEEVKRVCDVFQIPQIDFAQINKNKNELGPKVSSGTRG
ncbi:unnamed protein product [Bursaphelenchus okinawaensis]|uniref:Uncharacterized protein n=1 Tax=Bursaphelenchus okinawaensis TaxID=465554 RepID=A0A811KH70_9BILA|nr:unnamed protein product [Bursaphelenchus okinawaensis]CAG9103068.1 unnamed protein product [Bursaphelenchus okinawaensis]